MFNNPQRSVDNHCLQSFDSPPMRVQFASNLEYLGNLQSRVEERAQIDNYYFADRDEQGIIQRIVYLQFETYFPEATLNPKNPPLQAIQLGKMDFVYDGGVRNYRQSRIDELPSDSDVAQTVAFLKAKGVQFKDGEYYGSLRFVHQLENQRDEVLILYLERLEEADIPLDVIAHSRDSQAWPSFCEAFLARALRSFTVCE